MSKNIFDDCCQDELSDADSYRGNLLDTKIPVEKDGKGKDDEESEDLVI